MILIIKLNLSSVGKSNAFYVKMHQLTLPFLAIKCTMSVTQFIVYILTEIVELNDSNGKKEQFPTYIF